MKFNLSHHQSKEEVFKQIEQYLDEQGLQVVKSDRSRPWGGFFVIDESQAQKFAHLFFPEVSLDEINLSGKVSPKILVVESGKRLSWQYHHRRAEIWKLIAGEAAVVKSTTNQEGNKEILKTGEIVKLACGQRHRLIGLQNWGMLSEIWQHTDPANPSDEEDIVRVQDDYGR